MKQIKIDPKYKIDKVASDDIMRYQLSSPNYSNGILRATNGHAAVHIYLNSPDEGFPEGNISKEIFLRGRKNGHGKPFTINTNADDKMLSVNGERVWFEKEPDVAKYPNTAQVVDDAVKSRGKTILHINPELLLRVACAMGSPRSITLFIPENNPIEKCVTTPILATAVGDETVEGVVMPMRGTVPTRKRWESLKAEPVKEKVEIEV